MLLGITTFAIAVCFLSNRSAKPMTRRAVQTAALKSKTECGPILGFARSITVGIRLAAARVVKTQQWLATRPARHLDSLLSVRISSQSAIIVGFDSEEFQLKAPALSLMTRPISHACPLCTSSGW